ncbi:M20 family metallopeptidase [Cutibacterium sp.]|uniref:M20 metallopeptidase family protein n=1 Tax=Cutibacterium sp. TaxID=1912221 RepID=UPI0026DCB682|nr:M20 family metallopeptidase [Cutibacterium sp.]MDO4412094.1 M20 family metallopeptidase [Cutibacterium sp.]
MTADSRAQLLADLDRRASETGPDMISWRHHLHAHPELSNREENTASFIAKTLQQMGIDDIRTGIAGHGVVGILRGGQSGDGVIVLRADIDALPVPDESGVDFASREVDHDYPGGPFPVSHACGHDCHTAMLLGAMRVLSEQTDRLPGTVVSVFQPAEEGAPVNEIGGAKAMLEAGALDGLNPTMAFGMHVQPQPKGTVSIRSGNQFAASCMMRITVTGEQVHASTPWAGHDPMPAVGAILTGIGQIYRRNDATDPMTISVGHVEDVGRFNVVGGKVTLWGTIRSLSDTVMARAQQQVRDLAEGSAAAMGCRAEVDFLQPVPAVTNTPEWVEAVTGSLTDVVGADNVFEPHPTLGYDDVSEFINAFGGVYVGLGVQDTHFVDGQLQPVDGGRGGVPNHHPAFYADDETLVTGVRLHSHVAVDHLWSRI